ncbi:hypothetical protein [Pseudomonas aeruginosa]|uniref:hypothetical protein n=1 Tax=Pseudomonas aeruginosa TaxID=287 RepID=UPI003FD0E888
MTASKIQMDQIRSTSATVTGENIRAGSQKKSSLSPAEGLQGASPDATCTCPSGGGSLRHPCPAHPAVEQAGGDERDFQAEGAQEVPSPVSQEYDRHLISLLRKGEALPGHQEEAADEIERLRDWNDHLNNTVLPNILNPNFLMLMKGGERLLDLCTKDGKFIGVSLNDMKDVFDWMVTHARIAPDHAALAQPSPASDLDPLNLAPHAEAFNEAPAEALKPEPAEAERPEVVGVRYEDGTILSAEDCGIALEVCAKVQTPLMTVAQHERIVKAWIERWKAYIELSAKIAAQRDAAQAEVEALRAELQSQRERNTELIFKLGSATNGWGRCEKERDAALAEVERLRESKGDPVGSLEKCMKVMYERDEHAKRLEVAQARVAELEKQEPVATVAKVPGEDWNGLHFYRDLQGMQPGTKLYAAPVAQAQQLHDLDKQCRDDVARALGLRPNQERGFAWSYLLASIKSCVKASGDSAQAQHSVPIAHEFKRALGLVVAALEADGDRPTSKYALSELKKVLAAAPGTEVPQAWLDVQAERRRQITAEGWTPDHDDLYCAAELPRAAAAYILSGANDEAPAIWPFSAKWWKPRDARANYMRAGALILAEIERLDRAAERGKEVGHE